MGKLTALIVGYISVTFAAYVILSVSYNPLVNWVGPYLGYRFPFILGIVYLIAGSPIRNTIILETWIVIGALVGISARKGLRAWGSASLVWTFTTLTLGVSLIAMLGLSIFNISGTSAISSTVRGLLATFVAATAFVPYGTNLATIVAEPVLRVIVPYITSSLGSGTSTASIGKVIMNIALHAFENYLIFAVTAILVGSITHRILHGGKKVSKKAVAAALSIFIAFIFIAMVFSPGITPQTNLNASTGKASENGGIPVMGVNALFPFSISNGSAHINTNNEAAVSNASLGNSTNQAGLSLITPQGNLYNLFAMESGNGTGIWSGNGLIFGSFTITANMTSLLEKEYGINYGKLGSFIPQNALILAYNGTSYGSEAKSMASSVGQKMGTTFNTVLTLKNITLSGHLVTIYLYSSSASEYKLKSDFMSTFNRGYGGSIPAIFSKNEGLNNYNSYAMASGYINGSIVKSLTGNTGLNVSSMDFTAGIFKYSNYFHSSGDSHTYNISTLMNYNSGISFSKSSTLSVLGIGYNNGTGSVADIGRYTFNIYSNNASLASKTPLNTTNSSFTNVGQTRFSPSVVSVSFNAVFPADILYSTSVDRLSGHMVQITVHIKNNDTSSVQAFNASQSVFVNHYVKYGAASLISGKYKEVNVTIQPGHYANFTYNMSLSGVGIYVIPYTNISYNFQGKAFSYETNASYIVQNKPGYISAMNSMVNNEASQSTFFGNTLATVHGFEISLIDIVLLAIVLLDVVIEIRAFKSYIKKRDK
ncbi:MAG: hypothetical protein AMDU4_FER2C00091G0005 [Ferroplasma sp. Type II]|jgi:hypothetical protein|uniref:hypothetical protein n=1 Tax=Ferroplasma sp. Type II TaxID=261388 RepID=UPI0003894BEB|nr:hypothetical protein [Ferroplasma sp. Type II]EQB73197.1 MAG: hypothetical protein AMDU4_FER2C00091G0005 [Ferroplasma sp. Type II]